LYENILKINRVYFNSKIYFIFIGFEKKVIQKIEIPSCEAEPCVLKYGISLPVKITFIAGLRQD
jgi:hypothetical protein